MVKTGPNRPNPAPPSGGPPALERHVVDPNPAIATAATSGRTPRGAPRPRAGQAGAEPGTAPKTPPTRAPRTSPPPPRTPPRSKHPAVARRDQSRAWDNGSNNRTGGEPQPTVV